jgi:hypothetical protein
MDILVPNPLIGLGGQYSLRSQQTKGFSLAGFLAKGVLHLSQGL